MINEEFELIVSARATRALEEGEAVYAADFDEVAAIEPVGVDPDAGWITFFTVIAQTFGYPVRRLVSLGRPLVSHPTSEAAGFQAFVRTGEDRYADAGRVPAIVLCLHVNGSRKVLARR